MLLTELQIKNFRGIEDLTLPLGEVCVLVGENNVGKSTILDAIHKSLTRTTSRKGKVFDDYDYFLEDPSADPTKAKPIEITLTFAEKEENEWAEEISQIMEEVEQIDNENNLRFVILKVESFFNKATNDYSTEFNFLDLKGTKLVLKNRRLSLMYIQRLVPAFYLKSLRDASEEFKARSKYWGPFVKALELDDETQAELESDLDKLNAKVLSKHLAFENVKEKLSRVAKLLPLENENPVSIDAIPTKIFDILSRTEVSLIAKTGAQIPIIRHGEGAQSLAIICLFDAFLSHQLDELNSEHATPLLTLEEPEAHLHPSAIKAVGKMLKNILGQKIFTTHSGDLLSGIPLSHIRRLRNKNGKILAYWLKEETLDQDELNKLNYSIKSTRGGFLLSRCWLLVEGETESILLPECAFAMGYDLQAEGISCVEFSQVGVDKFIKLAKDLGIEWFVMADGDKAGDDYVNSAKKFLSGQDQSMRVCQLNYKNMEVLLCKEGFGEVYIDTISKQKKNNIIASEGTTEYWEQVTKNQQDKKKTPNAHTVSERIIKQGADSVPEILNSVIEKTIELARSAG